MSIEEKPCMDCTHFDPSDGMCTRKYTLGSFLVHRQPPMRSILWEGENQCGAAGNWFEPVADTAEERQ
jgi:hypothetical protein